jgi:hypothetical protein
MQTSDTIIVYRGPEVEASSLCQIVMELLGGHLRPDASLALHFSAPVRVNRLAASRSADPLAGTVRAIHLGVPEEDGILTSLSELALRDRLGFPEPVAKEGWQQFGHLPSDAVALALSNITGPVATLSQRIGDHEMGAYSVFSTGRRIWSSCYRPAVSYATWNGSELHVQQVTDGLPVVPEGKTSDFPAHGLQLLFGEEIGLTPLERSKLLPGLMLACRPPSTDAEGRLLVEEGRFRPPTPLAGDDWQRFQRSFSR